MSSLILAALSFVVMSTFINMQTSSCCSNNHKPESNEVQTPAFLKVHHCNTSHHEADNALMKAGFALSSFVLSTCLCCLMVCSMQYFFTSKILTASQGQGRSVSRVCVIVSSFDVTILSSDQTYFFFSQHREILRYI